MASTVAFLNMKGGVGKTSLCFHLAGELALQHRRVLLVDSDPQASLTQAFLGTSATMELDADSTILAAYQHASQPEGHPLVITPTAIAGIHLIAGSIYLSDFSMAESKTRVPIAALHDALKSFSEAYDHILIDCPPKIDTLAMRAMSASDGLVIPVTADDLGVQGIAHVMSATGAIRMRRGKPAMIGIAINKYRGHTKVEQLFAGALREGHGLDVFNGTIPQATAFPEALMYSKPIGHHKPGTRAGQAMTNFSLEYQRRVGERIAVVVRKDAV